MNYRLLISYDGTNYGGWQVQPNATSIQSLIQHALQIVLRTSTLSLTGSGRTDAGVHATGQVAHFTAQDTLDTKRLLASLNGLLPPEIRIRQIEPAEEDFHARYSATGKIYHYHLHLNRSLDPFKRLYSTHIPYPLDINLLQLASQTFIGTHDFSSFANEATKGSAAKNPIRTLKRLDLVEEPGGLRLEFEGNGFLYKMVRNITGTLLDIASGTLPLDKLNEIFEQKNRSLAGKTAPAQGLFLVQVHYPFETFKMGHP